MTVRNLEARIVKLEGAVPAAPHPLDGMTCDELTVLILDDCAAVAADKSTSEEERAEATKEFAGLARAIVENVNWRSGRWVKPPGFDNYEKHLEFFRRRWVEKTGGRPEDYVPTLTVHEGEGLGLPDYPVDPDVMTRRAALWARPVVQKIVRDAPSMALPDKSIFRECKSFATGRGLAGSAECGWACRQSCLRARRGGFRSDVAPASRGHAWRTGLHDHVNRKAPLRA